MIASVVVAILWGRVSLVLSRMVAVDARKRVVAVSGGSVRKT